MKYQTTYKYSRELEETLHPKISLIKKISKRSIICILWISLHYTDPQSVMDIKRLKLKIKNCKNGEIYLTGVLD